MLLWVRFEFLPVGEELCLLFSKSRKRLLSCREAHIVYLYEVCTQCEACNTSFSQRGTQRFGLREWHWAGLVIVHAVHLMFIESSEADYLTGPTAVWTAGQKASKYSETCSTWSFFFSWKNGGKKIEKSDKLKRDPRKFFMRDPRHFIYFLGFRRFSSCRKKWSFCTFVL